MRQNARTKRILGLLVILAVATGCWLVATSRVRIGGMAPRQDRSPSAGRNRDIDGSRPSLQYESESRGRPRPEETPWGGLNAEGAVEHSRDRTLSKRPFEPEVPTSRTVVVINNLSDLGTARALARLAGVPEEEVLPLLRTPIKIQALRNEYQRLSEAEAVARAVLHDLLFPLAEEKYAKGEFEVLANEAGVSWRDSDVEYAFRMGKVGSALHAVRFRRGDDPRSDAAWDARDGALLIVREDAKRVVATLNE